MTSSSPWWLTTSRPSGVRSRAWMPRCSPWRPPRPARRCTRCEDGLRLQPGANLAVLTIPGDYVYPEARKALEAGLHLFIFSSNVPLDQERELKQLARARGLLVMGPDCGTSILGGVGHRVRQRRASRDDRGHRPGGHRPAGVHLSGPPRGWRHLARHRDGQPRPVERHRRGDDPVGPRGARARPVDGGHRHRRQAGWRPDARGPCLPPAGLQQAGGGVPAGNDRPRAGSRTRVVGDDRRRAYRPRSSAARCPSRGRRPR